MLIIMVKFYNIISAHSMDEETIKMDFSTGDLK
jgi:hypothetical protein